MLYVTFEERTGDVRMKYKILLCGKSKAIIDDFFTHLEMEFETQSTSMHYGDIMSHLRIFEPDAIIFCMHKETDDTVHNLMKFKNKFERLSIPFIIVGSEEDCEQFQKDTYRMASLVLTKPISVRNIGAKVMKFVEEWKNKQVDVAVTKESAQEEYLSLFNDEVPVAEKTNATSQPALKHILVVDDDPLMLKIIKEHLKSRYNVATAISGAIALKFLETKKTDLIILDYEMPGENGGEVLRKIRDNDATSNLPVIFLTAMTDRDKIKAVLELKPQGYLLKPINTEKLLPIIESCIQ